MWRNKKLLIIEFLVVIILVAGVGLAAAAHADDTDTSRNQSKSSLIEKVAEIYQANTGTAIDPQELENAFTQAHEEMRTEALDEFLQKLIEEGKITQEQADEFKAWLDARPEALTEEFKEWLDSRPDIPGIFRPNNEHGGTFFTGPNHRVGITGGFGPRFQNGWSD